MLINSVVGIGSFIVFIGFVWVVCLLCVGSLRWMICERCTLLCLLIVLCVGGSSVSFGGFVVSG